MKYSALVLVVCLSMSGAHGQGLPQKLLTVTDMEQCNAFSRACWEAASARTNNYLSCSRAADKKYGDKMGKYFRDVRDCNGLMDFRPPECDSAGQFACEAKVYCQTESLACMDALQVAQNNAKQQRAEEDAQRRRLLAVPNETLLSYASAAHVGTGDIASEQARQVSRRNVAWKGIQKYELAKQLLALSSNSTPQKDRLQILGGLGISAGEPAFRGNVLSMILTETVFNSVLDMQSQAMADLEQAWHGANFDDSPQRLYQTSLKSLGPDVGSPLLARAMNDTAGLEYKGVSVSYNAYALEDIQQRERERQAEEEHEQHLQRMAELQAERDRLENERVARIDAQRQADAYAAANRRAQSEQRARQRAEVYERQAAERRERAAQSSPGFFGSLVQGVAKGLIGAEMAKSSSSGSSSSSYSSAPPKNDFTVNCRDPANDANPSCQVCEPGKNGGHAICRNPYHP